MDSVSKSANRRRDRRGLAYQMRMSRERGSMGSAVRWMLDVSGSVEPIEMAISAASRLKGMLFKDPDDVTRLLIPCNDIHTFGMRYPIDVAFIARDGKVLAVHRNVATRRRIKRADASLVAERFSREGEWLKEGDVIRIGCKDES